MRAVVDEQDVEMDGVAIVAVAVIDRAPSLAHQVLPSLETMPWIRMQGAV